MLVTNRIDGISDPTSEQGKECAHFLSALFSLLDRYHVRYCVLHSWEELPERVSSDLDLAVHPDDYSALWSVLVALSDEGFIPVQVFNYLIGAYYFVFLWFEGPNVRSVALDVIVEHRRGGLRTPSIHAILSGRRRHGTFWIPGPESEFAYLLVKKTWKRSASARQVSRLRWLVEELGRPTAERLAGELFLGRLNVRVVDACLEGRVDTLLAQQTLGQTWKTSIVRNPWRAATYILSEWVRRVRRWNQPTGFFIVVLGLDGTGKSTLIQQILQIFERTFRRSRTFHWRPSLLWRRASRGDTTQPHSRAPHSAMLSVALLFIYFADYWVGYCFAIRPLLARSGLVIFDRYFDDVAIDPLRYRYGGPLWLARALARLVPLPDVVLVLDAPENVVRSRKQEVAPDEVQRQRRLYLEYGNVTARARVIDAGGTVSDVSGEAARAIFDCLATRFQRRHASPSTRP
jgi:thymidylate kinase